jgi:hypothetical protein
MILLIITMKIMSEKTGTKITINKVPPFITDRDELYEVYKVSKLMLHILPATDE